MFWVVFITVEFLVAVVSVVAGNRGVSLPLMQVCAFYFCVKSTPWKAAPVILIFAGVLDGIWLHPFPAQLLCAGAVILFAAWWKHFGDLYAWTAVCGASLFCGACAWCAQWLASDGVANSFSSGWVSFGGQLLASVVSMLVLVSLMERILIRRLRPGLHEVVEEE